MKKTFSITDVSLNKISFRIGDDVGGYSCVSGVVSRNGYISVGSSSISGATKVWCFEYDPLPWHGVITDQELIKSIMNKDNSYWMPTLIKETLKIAAEADQLLHLVQKTIEMAKVDAYEKGRLNQAQAIVKSLGLDHSLVNLS